MKTLDLSVFINYKLASHPDGAVSVLLRGKKKKDSTLYYVTSLNQVQFIIDYFDKQKSQWSEKLL